MKIKILRVQDTIEIGKEFNTNAYYCNDPSRFSLDSGWVDHMDCVITELPKSFCVKKCDDVEKWNKCIKWLNKTYESEFDGNHWEYYGIWENGFYCNDKPIGTEIHIDDIIKHIDYMENTNYEFDLTTDNGRLAYAKQHYPIGTKYIPLFSNGESFGERMIQEIRYDIRLDDLGTLEGGLGYIYSNGKWAEIIKEEKNMETQKISRAGLKEIYDIACTNWKSKLEEYSKRNLFDDWVELTQEEVNEMFAASRPNQLPIVSKYLKQDDGNIEFDSILGDGYHLNGQKIISKRGFGQYRYKSFYLDNKFDWKIQKDEYDKACLIPTKKK